MKIFLAGICPYPEALEFAERTHPRFLHSFAYMWKANPAVLKHSWREQEIMLDSGGFSVRTAQAEGGRGTQFRLTVEKYRDFLLRMQGSYSHCLNLDTMSVDETLANQRALENAGLSPMPVYHYSDWVDRRHRHLLQQYIDEEYGYIGLGGMAGVLISADDKKRYLDFCFKKSGKTVRLHGLGLTSTQLMSYYPFYSVDSKTWLVSGLYGDYVTMRNGQYKRTAKKKDRLSHHGVLLSGAEKMRRAVATFTKLEQHLTDLWSRRGYEWN